MKKPKILVTRRWPEKVEIKLSETYDVTFNEADIALTTIDFCEALKKYDAILPTVTDIMPKKIFETTNIRTRILGNYGVGYAHIDISVAQSLGITVTNTPDVLSDCTADITLTLMLMAARRAGEGEREVRASQWKGWKPTHLVGTKLTGKTLGIIGFGRIGQEVAKRAHHGFGMKILVQNRSSIDRSILNQTKAVQIDKIDDLLPDIDFLSLHCPGGEENRDLISLAELKLMKQEAILINTARGEVVNDSALIYALKNKIIYAAGLDVYNGEPNLNKEYLDCPNATLLPHLGSATNETREAMGFRVIKNLDEFFSGQVPVDKVS
ncbi:D-glycerate dehydrogenase [Amylibacter sp.]|nr:D-glycerate dehydrogenase [Amylibacter sp.]